MKRFAPPLMMRNDLANCFSQQQEPATTDCAVPSLSVLFATFLTVILALAPMTPGYADWNEIIEEDEEPPVTEQFTPEEDDSGIPEPASDEPGQDEMDYQGELEDDDPE